MTPSYMWVGDAALRAELETHISLPETVSQGQMPLGLVALSKPLPREGYANLLSISNLRGLVIADQTFEWAVWTVRQLLEPGSYPWEGFFGAGSAVFDTSLGHSQMRFEVLAQLKTWLEERRIRERLSLGVIDLVDELLTNALYDAPVDSSGQRLYAEYSRLEHFALAHHQRPRLRLSLQGQTLWGEVRDPFGSLDPSKVCSLLADGLTGKISEKAGGAGIGLARVVQRVDWLGIVMNPGHQTSVRFGLKIGRRENLHVLATNLSLLITP